MATVKKAEGGAASSPYAARPWLASVELRDSLPKTAVGKILHRVLREEEEAKRKVGRG